MARRINDLVPFVSGQAHLGVDGSQGDAFDIASLAPFGHIHQISGVFHDGLVGTSGVVRYNGTVPCLEVSVDGGNTFGCVATTDNTVTSVGVIGDANLSGDVDFASPGSGFIVIEDTGNASPILWSVNTLGLSGLWNFPANGFPATMARCYSEDFTSQTSFAVNHNIGTTDVSVTVVDNSSPPEEIMPDSVVRTNANTITITFNTPTTGRVTVIGCV